SILSGMSRALQKYCNYPGEISTADSGRKAMDAISSGFYDICFLDLNLPDMNGLNVMEKIHSVSPKTKVVIMTAEYLEDDIKEKITNGAVLFIPKPIELDSLKAFIDKEASSDGDYEYSGDHGYTAEDDCVKHADGNSDRRACERRREAKKVSYSLSVFYNWELKSDIEADIIDISAGGIGLVTPYRLYPGTMLRFDGSLGDRTGMVKWSVADEKGCRAGIKFI
ncbi:MAG: response regulator, partial [Nitrospirota bacterium]